MVKIIFHQNHQQQDCLFLCSCLLRKSHATRFSYIICNNIELSYKRCIVLFILVAYKIISRSLYVQQQEESMILLATLTFQYKFHLHKRI